MYFKDPRENQINLSEGVVWEEDNRKETMYHWGAMVRDLCDMPIEEYMKPSTVIAIVTSGSSSGQTGETKDYMAYSYAKDISEIHGGNVLDITTEEIVEKGKASGKFKKGAVLDMSFIIPAVYIEGLEDMDPEEQDKIAEQHFTPFYFLSTTKPTTISNSLGSDVTALWKFETRTLSGSTTAYLYYSDDKENQTNVLDSKAKGEDREFKFTVKF